MAQPVKRSSSAKKKLKVKIEPLGKIHILASFNNLIVSVTNNQGDLITWSSSGKAGFKGSKKSTPYAAKCASEEACKAAFDLGVKRVHVFVNGPGQGRESAMRTIDICGINVESITDSTKIPFNGCRVPKRRRS